MFKTTARKRTPATFKPCLEPLEERSLLSASSTSPPVVVPTSHLSPDQINVAFQLVVASAQTTVGQQGTSNETSPILQMNNNWNSLGNDITSLNLDAIPDDAIATAKSVNDFTNSDLNTLDLQSVSQLPAGSARVGGDIALFYQASLEIMQGGTTFNSNLTLNGFHLAGGAVNDYVSGTVLPSFQQVAQTTSSLLPMG